MLDSAVLDLGELQGPLLIFGGPYSNLQALQALRQYAGQHGIAPEQCICTGDIVAYCAQPRETVAEIRDWGVRCLMGNCEASLAENQEDCDCGFEAGSSCDVLSVQWFRYANEQLAEQERTWFAQLPRRIQFTFNNMLCEVVHGSVSSINQFVYASHDAAIFEHEFAQTPATLILAGHSGLPFTKNIGDRCWHNAGVIGMPANDGTADTWYSIIDIDAQQKTRIQNKKLRYNHGLAQQNMYKAGLLNGYAEALQNGLWPSMDVLPETERLAQQQALVEYSLSI